MQGADHRMLGFRQHLPGRDDRGTLPAVSDQASTWRTAGRPRGHEAADADGTLRWRPNSTSSGPAGCISRRETKMSDKVVHVGDADFDSAVLNSKEPVLVDFWAEWCGPCKMIAPALDELADAYQGRAKIAKVNVDHNRALAAKYHVRSIPYLVVFKDGEKVGEQIGAVGKAQLAGLLDKALT